MRPAPIFVASLKDPASLAFVETALAGHGAIRELNQKG